MKESEFVSCARPLQLELIVTFRECFFVSLCADSGETTAYFRFLIKSVINREKKGKSSRFQLKISILSQGIITSRWVCLRSYLAPLIRAGTQRVSSESCNVSGQTTARGCRFHRFRCFFALPLCNLRVNVIAVHIECHTREDIPLPRAPYTARPLAFYFRNFRRSIFVPAVRPNQTVSNCRICFARNRIP